MIVKTFDPVIKEEKYVTSFFPKIPYVSPGEVVILSSSEGGTRMVITEKSTVRTGNLRRGKFNCMTKIDMKPHTIVFSDKYFSKDNISKFQIEIRATAFVEDSEQVYVQGLRNVTAYVEEEMRGQIQSVASEYGLESSNELREAIKIELKEFDKHVIGILVNNMNVTVRMDPKFEKLKEKTKYETMKVAEALKLQEIYDSSVTAIFAEVAEGNINMVEAMDRAKKSLSGDFDERLRQLKEAAAFANELKEQDLVRSSGVSEQMEEMIKGLIMENGTRVKLESQDQTKRIVSEKEVYASFDEED